MLIKNTRFKVFKLITYLNNEQFHRNIRTGVRISENYQTEVF